MRQGLCKAEALRQEVVSHVLFISNPHRLTYHVGIVWKLYQQPLRSSLLVLAGQTWMHYDTDMKKKSTELFRCDEYKIVSYICFVISDYQKYYGPRGTYFQSYLQEIVDWHYLTNGCQTDLLSFFGERPFVRNMIWDDDSSTHMGPACKHPLISCKASFSIFES